MHYPSVLKKHGCDPERLRKIFTSTGPGIDNKASGGGNSPQESLTTEGVKTLPNTSSVDNPSNSDHPEPGGKKEDWAIRRKFEDKIRSQVLNGIAINIRNNRCLQAVDMAWDSPPIQKETIPLLLWAQGKINFDNCHKWLKDNVSPSDLPTFVRKNDKGDAITIDLPRICNVTISLVRSYVTRRHAALAALWDNLWPLLKYDPRGSNQVAQCRADVLTQRIEMMADEYNYRHFLSQCDRDKLLYSMSVAFPRSSWDVKRSWRFKNTNALPDQQPTEDETEGYVTQEGVDFVNPHPSRIFWDLGAPLANINTENGPRYVGYWDIVPYRVIRDGDYYNKTSITISEAWTQLIQQEFGYFTQYFDKCALSWPDRKMQVDPSLGNDRTANIGLYTAETGEMGVLLLQWFECINPKHEGIGDYDADVWLRLVAAGDGTIVGAEFLPSLPGAYGAINANDNRVANASLAMEMLSFQDMASNIVATMIEEVRRCFTQIWVLNKDLIDPKICEEIEKNATNRSWWLDPKVLTMSLSEKAELLQGSVFSPDKVMFVIQPKIQAAIDSGIKALSQLLGLADRLVNSSPNEIGQPNPREVSARETQEISTTIQSVYSFYNEGPREQRTAFKKILYESLVCCAQDNFTVPVMKRYTKATLQKAGFDFEGMDKMADDELVDSQIPVTGNLHNLIYSYYFDSRDGAERALSTQGAQVLQQLLNGLLQIPGMAQKLGLERIFTMLNIIARMAGAPDEFQLELDDGEKSDIPTGQEKQPVPPEVQQSIQQVMAQMQEFAVKDAALEQAVMMISQKLGIQLPQGGTPQPPSAGGQPPGPTNGAAPPSGPTMPARMPGRALQAGP